MGDSKEDTTADSFVNDVSEAEGRQELSVEHEKEEEQEETNETNNEVTEDEKGIFKLKKDLETEDQGSESPIEIIGDNKDHENSEEKENEKEQGTEEDKTEGKTTDSFINEISESEGRQEPTVMPEKEEETKENSKEDKAADSFVNDVSEAEGRQEPTVEPENEKQLEDTKERTEAIEGEKGIFKLKKDLETEDQGSGSHKTESSIEIIGEIKDEENRK